MKNICLLFSILLLLGSCREDKAGYVDYNDAVVQQVRLADSTLQVVFSFQEFEAFPDKQSNYQSHLSQASAGLDEISWTEEDSLRMVARNLVSTYQQIIDTDYAGIYQLMHDSIYTAADSIQVDSFSTEMYAKWQIQSEHFASVQKSFGKKFGISLSK
jgi:hypothetical protein